MKLTGYQESIFFNFGTVTVGSNGSTKIRCWLLLGCLGATIHKVRPQLRGRGAGELHSVSISNSDVMLFGNNDVILLSDGGVGQKRAKNCGNLNQMCGPLLCCS